MTRDRGYSAADAQLYASLGIEGTTYEASFTVAVELLGDLRTLRCLDFGCGTGRSSLLLRSRGAEQVVGVDRNKSMLATAVPASGVAYVAIGSELPFEDESFDVVLASHVFMEFKTEDELSVTHRELARCLRRGGTFVAINMNPDSLGAQWLTFGYEPCPDVQSGDTVVCTVTTPDGVLRIQDVWWSQEDYERIAIDAGLQIEERLLPLASGTGWKDETVVAPDVVYKFSRA